ncbi:MAG: hypothetical protein IPQ01_03475 [Zoogloea sp.]|nr:hypothetical protein [Zoogloea sp.]MBP7393285.1 hypothetical protein [Zoogloea sp.]
MRNLLLFVLFLIGLFYARRALRGKSGNAGKAADKGPDAAGGGRQREAEHLEIEQMVACAHCGLHVPESESVRGAGEFFCSDEHRRLGVRR